jgi:hypothetical protein
VLNTSVKGRFSTGYSTLKIKPGGLNIISGTIPLSVKGRFSTGYSTLKIKWSTFAVQFF